MSSELTISKQEICDLIGKEELLSCLGAWYKSSLSIRPLSLPWNMVKGSCVELVKDSFQDIDLYVLNQTTPIGVGTKWKTASKDLRISLLATGTNDLYTVKTAVAFQHGYFANENPEPARLIFNTAVECVKDIVERGKTRYQTDRFKDLKRALENLA